MKEITDKEFQTFREYIKKQFGISLSNEKKSLVYSRLRNVLQDLNMDNFTEYYNYLLKDASGGAMVKFIDKITTNHTFFMRETDHFDHLREVVLPYIEKTYSSTADLRLWCAAASSGEEPYTLQMIIEDHFKNKIPSWNTETLATDISTQVLDKAVHGVYSNESISILPEKWQKEYFKAFDDENSQVIEEIRNKITYRKFNLMEEIFPFKKKFQVIFCRNVMIYFDNVTRDKLVKKFYDLTEDGGYLFIGHSESLNHSNALYKYQMPAVYRKI